MAKYWEGEFFHFLSEGDGNHCPLWENCALRKNGKWCIDDDYEKILPVYDKSFNPDTNPLLISRGCNSKIFKYLRYVAEDFLKQGCISKPPVPSELILCADSKNPIEIRYIPLKSTYGSLWRLSTGWVIQINSNLSRPMQRLSLFHEAFHILAHLKTAPVFRSRELNHGRFNEMLADAFSGMVLMPPSWVEEKWRETGSVRKMARIFDVPPQLVIIALKIMGLID